MSCIASVFLFPIDGTAEEALEQLEKENRKFFFGQVKQGGRLRDFELAIQWLTDAGLIYKVNKVLKPGMR